MLVLRCKYSFLAGLLIGCIIIFGANALAAGKVTLEVFWSDWGPIYNEEMRRIGEAYEKVNPNIHIKFTFLQDFSTNVQVKIAGGMAPDVIYITGMFLPGFVDKDLLNSLDPYYKQAGLSREAFTPAMWGYCNYKGHLWTVPGGADWTAMIWNKDVFEAVGLDGSKPLRTIKEFEFALDKLVRVDSKGKVISGLPISSLVGGGTRLLDWGHIFGGRLYDETANRITANHPKMLEALEWMKRLTEKYGGARMLEFWSSQREDDFITGRRPIVFDGFWYYETIDKLDPHVNWGAAPRPTPGGTMEEISREFLFGWNVAIPRVSKHPREAWEFIKWAFVDNAGLMGALTLNGPSAIASYQDFARRLRERVGPRHQLMQNMGAFVTIATRATSFFPVLPNSENYWKLLTQAEISTLRGEKSPLVALDEVTRVVQAELDKSFSQTKIR